MLRIIYFVLVSFVCFSCTKEYVPPQISIQDRLIEPLRVGSEKIYLYTSIRIDVLAGMRDTSVLLVKETITDSLIDTLGYTTFRIERMRRLADTLPWLPFSVWSIRVKGNQIIRIEENIPYVVLAFPLVSQKTWDGNQYNTFTQEKYTYSNLYITDTVLQNSFDSVVVVSQKNFKTLYTYQLKQEKYAQSIGMIFREMIDVESQPTHAEINLTLPIEKRITKGTIETYELIQY